MSNIHTILSFLIARYLCDGDMQDFLQDEIGVLKIEVQALRDKLAARSAELSALLN